MADAAKNALSLLLLSFFLLPCLTNASSISNGADNPAASGSEPLATTVLAWCVAKPGATTEALQANIQYACGGGIADCSAIQVGGPCYSQDIVRQASYAMNAYYYAAGHKDINCYFKGTGLVVYKDPSYGNCIYPS